MIRVDIITIEGTQYRKTWSDAGRYVVREGTSYTEAIDPMEYPREYTEGEYIDGGDEELTNDELVTILFGGNEQ